MVEVYLLEDYYREIVVREEAARKSGRGAYCCKRYTVVYQVRYTSKYVGI